MDRRIAFGERLKAIRKGLGYSQERLAELASLHRTYIGGVERGECNISLVNIWRIADALEISPPAIFAASGGLTAGAKRTLRKGGAWTKRRKR